MSLHWDGVTASGFGWVASAYSPTLNRIVAISQNNGTNVMTSDDGGATWTQQGTKWVANMGGDGYSLSNGRANGIVWDPTTAQFLGVQIATHAGPLTGLFLYKSADGITWTRTLIADVTTVGSIPLVLPICIGGGYCVIGFWGSSVGTRIYSATLADLTTWAFTTVPADLKPQALVYASGTYVAIGVSASIPIITATDPTVTAPTVGGWTGQMGFQVGFINKDWYGLAYGAGGWVAVTRDTDGAGAAMNSGDGATWALQTMPAISGFSSGNGWDGLIYQAAVGFIAVNATPTTASNGSAVSITGGTSWTFVTTPDQVPPNDDGARWTCLVYDSGHGKYVGFARALQTYNVMTQLSHWYYNPDTDHYQYASSDPGAPWILQNPTLTVNCGATTPTSGPTAGGTVLTIHGTGFGDGATVTLGGVALSPVSVVDQTEITGTTGAHAVGTVDLVVTNPDGTSVTCPLAFTYANGFLDLSGEAPGGIVVGGSGGDPGSGGNPGNGQVCVPALPNGTDGGSASGCADTLPNGSDSGGGSGCPVQL